MPEKYKTAVIFVHSPFLLNLCTNRFFIVYFRISTLAGESVILCRKT